MKWIIAMLSLLVVGLGIAVAVLAVTFRHELDAVSAKVAVYSGFFADPSELPLLPAPPGQTIPVDFYWTDYHERALRSYSARPAGILLLLEEGPMEWGEILDTLTVGGNRELIRDLMVQMRQSDMIRTAGGLGLPYELGDEGRRLLAAYRQIPEWLMDYESCFRWRGHLVDCLEEVPNVPEGFVKVLPHE